MAELTLQQQQALALAQARRLRTAEQPSLTEDLLKSGGSGLAQGAMELAGLPGTISDAVNHGGSWLLRKGYKAVTGDEPSSDGGYVERFFAEPDPEVMKKLGYADGKVPDAPISGKKIREMVSGLTGGATEYQPKTTAGKYTQTASSFVPGAATFGGGSLANIAKFGAVPGVASEAAGQATEGSALEPYARAGAALLTPSMISMLRRGITPNAVSPERAALADTLKSEGVDITAGQKTGSKSLRYAESQLGGAKAADMMERQGEQFTKAALSRAGINSDRAAPEVLDDAFTRIGKQFDDLAARNNITPDKQLLQGMGDVWQTYKGNTPAQAPVIRDTIEKIIEAGQKGSVPGELYKSLHSKLFRASRTAEPELKSAALDLRNVLDDAMERSLPAGSKDIGLWREARTQYKNLLVLEKAATGAGEKAAQGIISPSGLRNATVSQSRRNYARGKGDFADLARAGEGLMKPLPDSGTASRLNAHGLGTSIASLVGGGIGGSLGATSGIPMASAAGAIAGGMAGAALPKVAGSALMSRPAQAYLGNQLLSRQPIVRDPKQLAILEAILGRSVGVPAPQEKRR